MNNLSYSTFIPDPQKFTNHGIQGCPTHGYSAIITTNDGNSTQKCMTCGWMRQVNNNITQRR